MAIKKGTLDELLSGRDPKQVFSKDGLFDEPKKALAERVLKAGLDQHLDGEAAAGKANHRNGYSKKTVLTGSAKLDSRIPRDREGTFDPTDNGSCYRSSAFRKACRDHGLKHIRTRPLATFSRRTRPSSRGTHRNRWRSAVSIGSEGCYS